MKYYKKDKRKNPIKAKQKREQTLTKTCKDLEIGKEYRYCEICDVLQDERRKGSGGKAAQLKYWRRFFDYDKQDTKYIVKEIYDIPKEPEIRYPANTKYTEDITQIFLYYLQNDMAYTNVAYLIIEELLLLSGVVNEEYFSLRKKWLDMEYDLRIFEEVESLKDYKRDLSHEIKNEYEINGQDISYEKIYEYINNFWYVYINKLTEKIKVVLHSMQKNELIKYTFENNSFYKIYHITVSSNSYEYCHITSDKEMKEKQKAVNNKIIEYLYGIDKDPESKIAYTYLCEKLIRI